MDLSLSAGIGYNSWSNTLRSQGGGRSSFGWKVVRANVSAVDITQYLDKSALKDGLDANDVYEAGRHITMIVGVYGSTKGTYWDNVQVLLRAFTPTLAFAAESALLGFRALTFNQPTADTTTWPINTYPNGVPMQYFARPTAPPAYTVEAAATAAVADRGNSGLFSVSLICRDPRKYAQALQTYAITTSTQTGTYRGDYYSFPIITFSVSASGSSAFTLTVAGQQTIINLSSVSSGDYALDYGKRTFVDGNGNSMFGLMTTPTYPYMKSGASTFLMSNTAGISNPSITYREAWA